MIVHIHLSLRQNCYFKCTQEAAFQHIQEKEALFWYSQYPTILNKHSEGTEVAKYFCADMFEI